MKRMLLLRGMKMNLNFESCGHQKPNNFSIFPSWISGIQKLMGARKNCATSCGACVLKIAVHISSSLVNFWEHD